MYHLKKKISEVTSFCCSAKSMIYCTNFEKLVKGDSNEIIYESEYNLTELYYSDIFFCNETNPGSGILIKNQNVIRLESKMIIAVLNQVEFLCSYMAEIVKVNISNDSLTKILLYDIFIFLLYKEYLFSSNNGKIVKTSLIDEKSTDLLEFAEAYKLQLELGGEKKGEVSQFIGVYNNILWVLLNGGRFIGIDVNSGTVKHFIKNTPQEYIHGTIDLHRKGKEGYRSPSDRSFYHLDSQNGKIIGESAKGIWEIDLTKSEPHLEVWGMDDQYKNYGLKDIGYKTLLLGTDLYFIDYNALKWGIIDLPTKRVKWVSDKITEAKVQLKEIQCGGNRVYVLDGTKTLHIFERE